MEGTAFDLESTAEGEGREARLKERFKKIKVRRLKKGHNNIVL